MIYVLAAAFVLTVLFVWHKRARSEVYRELARRRDRLSGSLAPTIATRVDPAALHGAFVADPLARIDDFFDAATLAVLQSEARANRARAERSYIPLHKQGGTLSYEAVHRHAPACLALYHSEALRGCLSTLVGLPLWPAADHDQSACSILYYDRAGDHIGWHLDHNFYRGRHFTVLLSLIDRGAGGGLSSGRLQRRSGAEESEVGAGENSLVVFEGARVSHRATAVRDGDQRIVLSMTFSTDPRVHPLKGLIRRVKDMAYFGPRALID